ncbi:hypothetical protein N7510_006744 [Penicillium lagena]|uniref:uncharacterized protein n=1 Tax=Penicillium lagena TaxID=94218 RepID=UPI00254189D4|nr:uncharacterized protein N7510_006744 [Penicillium lagena]KAJ5610025.1 hypothetical protein N7510_006744 [Penicillium lagena]
MSLRRLTRGSPLLSLSSRVCIPRLSSRLFATAMDDNIKQHYLADSPPTVVRLEIRPHFETLQDPSLRKYAHYMSR